MYCVKCGAQLPPNGKFCPKCGAPAGGQNRAGEEEKYYRPTQDEAAASPSQARSAEPSRPGFFKIAVKVFAVCAELCLLCGLVACGSEAAANEETITGIDAIREFIEFGTDASDWEACLGLLLCSIGALLVFFISFGGARAFVINLVLSSMCFIGALIMFVYYRFMCSYAHVVYGAYLMLVSYGMMFLSNLAGVIRGQRP